MIYFTLAILILILVIYNIYLNYKVFKKQSEIESLISSIILIDEGKHKEEILKAIEDLKLPNITNTILRLKSFNEDIIKFIFYDEKESELFIHYTNQEEIARTILENGFMFLHYFYKTTEHVHNDKIDLTYTHLKRKDFGKYVIVISIAKSVYNFYKNEVNARSPKVFLEQVLTEIPPHLDENGEMIFSLSPHFIKGYFNYETGDIFRNPLFNASYDSPKFIENLESFKKGYVKNN